MLKTLLLGTVLFASSAFALCPIPPIPPIGCKLGNCVCDAKGQNCHYEFICQ